MSGNCEYNESDDPGDVKLQNDKDHAKQTVSQLAHLNNAQKHMEDTLIDSETTRTAVKQDLTEVQAFQFNLLPG